MRIVHFSDSHAVLKQLPPADLYICSGDVFPNFPIAVFTTGIWDPCSGTPQPSFKNFIRWSIDPVREAQKQQEWLVANPIRPFLGSPDAPVVCCRGNHDFTDLSPWFGGETYEIQDPTQVFDVNGIRVGGKRGIPWIDGVWSDEESADEARHSADKIPDELDILVTHAAPYQILDYEISAGLLGCRGLRRWIDRQIYGAGVVKLHCFGHIHGSRGTEEQAGIMFSNAATTFNELQIEET